MGGRPDVEPQDDGVERQECVGGRMVKMGVLE
jgi:hypothetical protein